MGLRWKRLSLREGNTAQHHEGGTGLESGSARLRHLRWSYCKVLLLWEPVWKCTCSITRSWAWHPTQLFQGLLFHWSIVDNESLGESNPAGQIPGSQLVEGEGAREHIKPQDRIEPTLCLAKASTYINRKCAQPDSSECDSQKHVQCRTCSTRQ